MIIVEEFSKAYQRTVAVRELSFKLEAGQILGLVGRNGAGKTTTLRSLAGIIPISSGGLSVGGFDLVSQPLAAKKLTAYVPDDPQLFNDLSIEQHLKFTASVYEIEHPAAHVNELLDIFELTSKRQTRADQLSRGMRQKLAICCAYLSNPRALLLDEPMTGLDPQAIRVLKQSILQIAEKGAAVIISSHLLAMVEDICSHALILDAGQGKFFGTLRELQTTFGDQPGAANDSSLESAYFAAVMATPSMPMNPAIIANH